ncbi:Holliday junction DNA helicase subunit RuvA [Humidesulfovibrio mexicanus]|uniref:Holliday junction branch migration complex subunit RuvA n=1 Tax=Humidesulfovibrio mexicanus TaxID=147047 RepID=A0A238Y568_9BACT|nr:Holliday junction branch migration protein RuvA [Humidesulfovibrio mexicanus]SNR66112.1 Holliday junction DNA helicase subunit RuvA [Humidesulfovibrio mexicanus]
MIAYLEGRLLDLTAKGCVLVTPGGVGYEVSLPSSALVLLPQKGGEAHLYTHMVVREDALDLYGFITSDERDLFRLLIGIDKLGPKKALGILSHFRPEHLRELVLREDADMLATVPGIGPKSAREIMWKLKDKVTGIKTGPTLAATPQNAPQGEYFDAVAGMKALGYTEDEARPMIKEIFEAEPDIDASSAIRVALKKIAAARS